MQALDALRIANEIRIGRATLKRRINQGEVNPIDVIQTPPPCAETMTVLELLRAQMRWGPNRSISFLNMIQVVPRRKLGNLTLGEKERLVEALRQKVKVAA